MTGMVGLRFFFFGLAFCAILYAAVLVAHIIDVDFLHHNPYRTHGNALSMIFLSPIYGAFGTIMLMSAPIFACTVLAMIAFKFLHRVDIWLIILAMPFSFMFTILQYIFFERNLQLGINMTEDPPPWPRNASDTAEIFRHLDLARFMVPQLYLFGCWWLVRNVRPAAGQPTAF